MKVLIGITGSISAYKILSLIRKLKKNNHDVQVILTEAGSKFIPTLAIKSFGVNYYIDQFSEDFNQPPHVFLSKWADIFLIAPATLNTISKMALGICDNLLLSTFFVFKKPVMIAPAMNENMYNQDILKKHLKYLKSQGIIEIPPKGGELASYDEGIGLLEDIDIIYEEVLHHNDYNEKFKNKNILISAGGSIEHIDPVRVITNLSTGTMGKELALAFYRAGANVKVITSKKLLLPFRIEQIMVKSVKDYYRAIIKQKKWFDVYISSAALSDFIPEYSKRKIKKADFKGTLILKKGKDILKELSKVKNKEQIIVGFAAETEIDINSIKKKFAQKPVDMIVVNKISENSGFGDRSVEGLILYNKKIIEINKKNKRAVAQMILKLL